jgi:hypothetical protein
VDETTREFIWAVSHESDFDEFDAADTACKATPDHFHLSATQPDHVESVLTATVRVVVAPH